MLLLLIQMIDMCFLWLQLLRQPWHYTGSASKQWQCSFNIQQPSQSVDAFTVLKSVVSFIFVSLYHHLQLNNKQWLVLPQTTGQVTIVKRQLHAVYHKKCNSARQLILHKFADSVTNSGVLVIHNSGPASSGGARILEQAGPAAGPKVVW